ncbi:MAG TPA: tetratricopeptide repeat protein [Hyphomicrobiaceae bacterium]|nr:tetratricopeptide repeat protein [Hyphomicrobiaceae bacterium]
MRARKGRRAILTTLIAAGCLTVAPALLCALESETAETTETTHTLVGSYLAGRFAKNQHETDNAADFYRSALTQDPGSDLLLEQAFLMEATLARWPRALKLAEELVAVESQHRMARLFLGLNEFKAGAYKKAEEHIRAAASGPIGELTSALALAWVKLAEGEVSAALAVLELPKQAEWAQFYLRYHRALIADFAGRRQDARAAFERAFQQDSRTLRTALAYARHAAHAGDIKLANTILKEQVDKAQGDGHPLARSLRDEIQSGKRTSLIVTSPPEGLAEVFYGLGEALIGEGAVGIGVLYLQMALYIVPEHPFALAALANAHEANKRYDEALAVYERIPKGSPLQSAIEIRKSFNLNSLERPDEARRTLVNLLESASSATVEAGDGQGATSPSSTATEADDGAQSAILKLGSKGDRVRTLQEALNELGHRVGPADGAFGDSTRRAVRKFQDENGLDADGVAGPATYAAILQRSSGSGSKGLEQRQPEGTRKPGLSVNEQLQILDALGNIMRSRKLYSEAVGYYDRAIALIAKPEKRHWAYYYARGTSYERLKNWPAAEVDLEKALALYPDQPLALNYLGYSWIDQGHNLKEGMNLIAKAVALKPDDGYIVDSLGWAHFRQGNFKEAVRYLERAVELKPDDPVLNDHLGDALWRVGREREARFQWDQALSLKPEPEDADRIKKKLEHGLSDAAEASAVTSKQASKGEPEKK